MRGAIKAATPGKLPKQWQKDAEALMQEELLDLGLIKAAEVRKQDPEKPALKRYFMHGIGHPLGLDVHDLTLTTRPIQPGWVLTVEPGIYLPEEGFAVRLENNIVVQEGGNVDLMADIPVEPQDLTALMHHRK
jgi:Xaa-Pro aminopeptidase